MKSHNTFNNEGNNNDRRKNYFVVTLYLCRCCPATFFSSHQWIIHFLRELFVMYNPQVANNKLKDVLKDDFNPKTCHYYRGTKSVNRKFSCAVENLKFTQMPDDDFEQFESNDLYKMITPPGLTEVYAYFLHDFDRLPFVLNDQATVRSLPMLPPPPPPPPPPLSTASIWSRQPDRVTLDLLSGLDQPIASIQNQGTQPRHNLMNVDQQADGQEASPPGLLLTLCSPVPDDEIEATTLILGPPGTEKDSIKKSKLDLKLKM